ncbi:MAG: J domain-containing protein [Gemmatimonadales bacterium]
MSRITRAYRVLGLPPDASGDEIKTAYRDLVQVWHPDRFGHDERLRHKAERNLQRINDAYERVRSHEPMPRPERQSQARVSFEAVRGLGDMLQSGIHRVSRMFSRSEIRIVGLELTAGERARQARGRARRAWGILLALLLTLAGVVALVFVLAR